MGAGGIPNHDELSVNLPMRREAFCKDTVVTRSTVERHNMVKT